MSIDLGQILSSLGLADDAQQVIGYVKAQLAAFKALPLTYSRLATQQTNLVKALQGRAGVSASDVARVQNDAGRITQLRADWAALDPQVDQAIGNINAGSLGDLAGVAAGIVSQLRDSKAVADELDGISSKYLSAAERAQLGSSGTFSLGVLLLLGAGAWLILRPRR
jgi:hypothetical protein